LSDLALEAAELARVRDQLDVLLSRHSGRSVTAVRADTDRALVLAGEEAVAYGVADVVPARSSGGQSEAGDALRPAGS
jgi:ATP-dependent Clp protease protease subunit